MNSKYFFLFLLVLAIASGVYFFKDEVFQTGQKTAWNFVPKNAVAVWESNTTIEVWNRFLKTDHWSNLSGVGSFANINTDLIYLDSITGSAGSLDRLFSTGKFLISTHTVSRNQFDHVFFLELINEEFRNDVLKITNDFQVDKSVTYSERTYHDQLIIEVNDLRSKMTFSYFIKDNFFVASFTPFLIEDAIRTIKRENPNFKEEHTVAFELASLEFDAGNLYINLINLGSFATLFFEKADEQFLDPFRHLSGSGFLDIDFDKSFIYANGFIVPKTDSSYLSVFKGQRPVAGDFSDFIPGNSAKIFYQSFTDPATWYKNISNYWTKYDRNFSVRLDSLSQNMNFDIDRMLSWLDSKLILIDLESVDENTGKMILIESKDIYESLNQLNKITELVNKDVNDTLYYENYGEATIRLLNFSEFPARLFGKWYSGFPVTYYTLIGPYVVLANDVEPIKELISDRESENTWRKSVSKSEFITNTLDESNLGLMISTGKAWGYLLPKLAPYWRKGWNEHSRNIKQIELASIQLSQSVDKQYASIVLKNRASLDREATTAMAKEVLAVNIGSPIILKPKVTRNHVDGSWETLIFDSLHQLSLINRKGQILWKQSLSNTITGEIYQVDIYKNRKLQYLIATDSLLYVIDRNGEFVENYPISINDIETSKLSVIDYDNSKNYRFMLVESNGDVHLLSKEGSRLEGWSPRSFEGKFSIYPFHVRVRGRDVILGIKENGEVLATNRRGETLPGFPLDLDVQIRGDIFYQIKSGFDRTTFTVVSEEGELIWFNLNGKIVEKQQLYRPATDTRFWIVKESLDKTYLIARQDLNRLAILDNEGEILFEKDYFESNPFVVQYYNFGAGQEVIVVLNAEPGKALIYNSNGTLIAPELESDYPVSIIHSEARSEYLIYTSSGDNLNIYSIQE